MMDLVFYLLHPLGWWLRHEHGLGAALYEAPVDLPVLAYPVPR